MPLPPLSRRGAQRSGVVLLLVVSVLAMLAVLGLAFVLYANASRQSARLHLEAQSARLPDVEPELLLSHFLGQLLFDAHDDERGIYSSLRGHGLARGMYGLNNAIGTDGLARRNARGELVDASGAVLNEVPYNGTGRREADPALPFPVVPDDTPAKDDRNLVNYTFFAGHKFLRDPERPGSRDGPRPAGQPDNRKPYIGGANAPYTYPDLNNLFLAAVKADGTVLLPSYHRPWAGFGALGPDNWRWTSNIDPTLTSGDPLFRRPQPWLRYLVLRPRPIDMGPGFPLPEDDGGDIKNLIGAPGGNDSFWIDLDFPVLRAPDGLRYKPLFAPLIVDLDNRVNLNVHGSLRGGNQGWGPWEGDPKQVAALPPPFAPDRAAAVARRAEWTNLYAGGKGPWDAGRYGPPPGTVAPGVQGRFYAPVDFDGVRELAQPARPSLKLRLPGFRRTTPYSCFPTVPAGGGYADDPVAERTNHPLLFDRAFALSNMEALLRHGDTGSPALSSELFRLLPKNFLDEADATGSARRRRLVTLASFDLDRPGVSPWWWAATPRDANYLGLPPRPPVPAVSQHPAGGAVGAPPVGPLLESEFGPDGRTAAALTALRRLDLARHLPDYPNPDPQGRITDLVGFAVAQRARQHMAGELFDLLWRVTGAGNPALVAPPGTPRHDQGRFDALRWLAQLAVNIVDGLDADDYMTPFVWYTDPRTGRAECVYGTELPRVVVNEVYAEYGNVATDRGLVGPAPRATQLRGNVWVELVNTFRDDPPLTAPYRKGEARLEVPPSGVRPGYGVYRVLLAKLDASLRQPDNVRGEVLRGMGALLGILSNFTPAPGTGSSGVDTRLVLPAAPANAQGYFGSEGGNQGFYVLGPALPAGEKGPFSAQPFETVRRPEMSYLVAANHPDLLPRPSVLLQRLACPHLPPQPSLLLPFHNPYVTVDYVRDVPPNYAAAIGFQGPGQPRPPAPLTDRASVGRKQPYAAHPSQLVRQRPLPARAAEPQHTFFQHNADVTVPGPNWRTPPRDYPPFDWLVHLDRPPVSPIELFHVSAFPPSELTQQFRTGDEVEKKFTHRAPWLDEGLAGTSTPQSHRLYRALEFLTTGSRLPGMGTAVTTSPGALPAGPDQTVVPKAMSGATASGGSWRIEPGASLVIDRGRASEEVVRVKVVGPSRAPAWFVADFVRPHSAGFTISPVTVSERVPGKVNLNTVWDEETFVALCGPNPANSFNENVARSLFRQLRASRTVGGDAPGPSDRPFRSLVAGLSPEGYDEGWLQDTLLRFGSPGSPTRQPILAVPGQPHPYLTYELLNKVFQHSTVRSNVFAVWLTVGFFEVADDQARPVKLGAEVGRAHGRQVRHRMFAIVDRSVLTGNPGPRPRFDLRAPLPNFTTGPVVPYFSVID